MRKIIAVFALLLAALCICAAEIQGLCVGVSDGDTITVLDSMDKGRFRVRLAGIDAPEKKQAFGAVAKKHLSGLVFNKQVSVRFREVDRYGRIVGRVYVAGVDTGLAMLSAGLAWHYVQYDNTPEYAAAEKQARAAGLGLWADRSPVPPWDFRHKK